MSERRHRMSNRELPHVVRAVENQLRDYLQFRRQEDLEAAQQLFRLWWRVMRHRIGKPGYPDPMNWGVIEKHVGGPDAEVMEPYLMVPKGEVGESGPKAQRGETEGGV